MTTTIELQDHEVRKVRAAVGEMIDYHHSNGNNAPANEYREIAEKLSEASE